MTSPAKLTDTQLAILSAASQRGDRCLIAPSTLKGGAAQKVAAKLLTAGLVREIKAKAGMEVWRRDQETGQAYSLKLTDAGLKAIAVDECGSQSMPSTGVAEHERWCVGSEDWGECHGGPERNDRANSDGAPPRHEDRARGRIAPTRSGRQLG